MERRDFIVKSGTILTATAFLGILGNSNNLFGVTKNFEGLGIKINEVNLISILNDKGANIEKTYFNEYYHKNLSIKVECPYCKKLVAKQTLGRHISTVQKCIKSRNI
jgi:hypothetical protein